MQCPPARRWKTCCSTSRFPPWRAVTCATSGAALMSRSANSLPILITMGEPSGIGPEIALAACDALGGRIGDHALKLVGYPAVFPGRDVIATQAKTTATPGKPDIKNAAAVIEAIE